MGMKKILTTIVIFIVLIFQVSAVTVVQNTATNENTPAQSSLAVTVVTIFVFSMLAFIVIAIFLFVIIKIYKYLSNHEREKFDFIFGMFERDTMQCITGADSLLKWRLKRYAMLFFKKRPVLANTEKGLIPLGLYNGESIKKESLYLISITNKVSMFKSIDKIIIIPNEIKSIVRKEIIDGKKVMIIDCEGLDQIGNTDYYFIPLIIDAKNKNKYLDFSDKIHKDYFEVTVYRDIIKENLQSYREGIIKSVESNPSLQFKRRSQ